MTRQEFLAQVVKEYERLQMGYHFSFNPAEKMVDAAIMVLAGQLFQELKDMGDTETAAYVKASLLAILAPPGERGSR